MGNAKKWWSEEQSNISLCLKETVTYANKVILKNIINFGGPNKSFTV